MSQQTIWMNVQNRLRMERMARWKGQHGPCSGHGTLDMRVRLALEVLRGP